VKGLDGSVLVLQPNTTEPVRVPLGMTVEVVLHPGYGQDIVSVNGSILAAASNPRATSRRSADSPVRTSGPSGRSTAAWAI
jgi:hypothetical protein